MEKNEVYDYLAKVYLDKQLDRQPSATAAASEKKKLSLPWWKYALFLILPIIAIPPLYLSLSHSVQRHKAKLQSSLYLATGNEQIKIKYNFIASDIKKEGYAITLSDFNAEGFQYLEFNARRHKNFGRAHLRVELENGLRENAVNYIRDIDNKWKLHTIKLSNFKEITSWDNLRRIIFGIEEWNVQDKDDCVYIDEVRFTK